ncbi:MAG TPA: DCC1-like thiol-disulfide oxidoreductase family protein [Gemmatimonadales bacterium]|nr:DCC1-like thiol-disulfide oxidoreductase family protein [Gemmatimonadales bacterium]
MVSPAILLYDGTCGFCQASVRFVLRHERRHTLCFAPLRGRTGETILSRHPELVALDSVIWVDGAGTPAERVRIRSAATLRVLGYLGGPWSLLTVGRLVPPILRDAIYRLVSRHRHRIPVASDDCALPSTLVRERFLA